MTLQDKFLAVEEDMNTVLLDRATEVHLGVLAILSKRHMFMLGEPGVAKSMLVDELVARIVDARKFKWQLTKTSVPEELFGGPDLLTLKEKGIYRRITEGKLPDCEFAFIDEIFNASDSTLNGLLLIINEGLFLNPLDDPKVPLLTMFCASNFMPQTAELEALVDRIVIRAVVKPLSDDADFVEMLKSSSREPKAFITLDEIRQAQEEVAAVVIGEHIIDALVSIRHSLKENDIKVSDRRFHQIISIVQAEAWLEGRTYAEVSHTKNLVHTLWRDVSQIETIRQIVLDLADPIERDVLALRDEMEKVYAEFCNVMNDTENPNRRGKQAMETLGYYKKAKREWNELYLQAKERGQVSSSLNEFKRRLKEIGPHILNTGLSIPEDQVDDFDESLSRRSDEF